MFPSGGTLNQEALPAGVTWGYVKRLAIDEIVPVTLAKGPVDTALFEDWIARNLVMHISKFVSQ
jgi:hypothetical protein